MTCILNILLNLSLLPARSWIAELGLEQVVTGHRQETDIDVALLATADLVDRRAHVVVDAAARDAAEDPECMIVGIEQHLVRLKEIGPNNESAAIAQLRVCACSLVLSLPMMAQSSDQSNWNASPGSKTRGTNVPRPVVRNSLCRSAFHSRAKAATRQ